MIKKPTYCVAGLPVSSRRCQSTFTGYGKYGNYKGGKTKKITRSSPIHLSQCLTDKGQRAHTILWVVLHPDWTMAGCVEEENTRHTDCT